MNEQEFYQEINKITLEDRQRIETLNQQMDYLLDPEKGNIQTDEGIYKQTRPCPAKWKCKRCGNLYEIELLPHTCECHSREFEYNYKNKNDLIDFFINNTPTLSLQIKTLLLLNQKDLATEILTEVIKNKYPFYTTRSDELPEIWTYEKGIYVPNGKTFIKEFVRKTTKEQYHPLIASRVIAKIETDTYIDAQTFFSNNIIEEIPCENGILNLQTLELKPFDEKKIHFIKIPVKHNPQATCPKIDSFLHSIFQTEEDVKTAYELIGYCLWKQYKLEKAAILLGDGSNGKDTFLELLKRFLGANNTKSISLGLLEKDRFSESELFQKLANLAGELSKSAIKEDSKFKALTGRSQLSAARKFKEQITFVNFSKQIFAANTLPKVDDMTDGFWRRWIYLLFVYKFETQENIEKLRALGEDVSKFKLKDPEILDKICTPEEFSGLLNKSTQLINEVWARKSFTFSKSSNETSLFWIRKSDSFLAFALENIEQSPEAFVLKESVRKAYQFYCKRNKVYPETDKHIAKIMQTHFGAIDSRKTVNDMQEYVWEGIQLKDNLL